MGTVLQWSLCHEGHMGQDGEDHKRLEFKGRAGS